MRNTAAMKMDEAVTVGLNCLELGIEDKETIKQIILTELNQYYYPVWDVQTPEELPVRVFEILHEQLGIGFDVHNGRIQAVSIERKEPMSQFEKLFGRLGLIGANWSLQPSIGVITGLNQETE